MTLCSINMDDGWMHVVFVIGDNVKGVPCCAAVMAGKL